jgi:hypothetical protein
MFDFYLLIYLYLYYGFLYNSDAQKEMVRKLTAENRKKELFFVNFLPCCMWFGVLIRVMVLSNKHFG